MRGRWNVRLAIRFMKEDEPARWWIVDWTREDFHKWWTYRRASGGWAQSEAEARLLGFLGYHFNKGRKDGKIISVDFNTQPIATHRRAWKRGR